MKSESESNRYEEENVLDDFALILCPGEAQGLIPNWPDNMWLSAMRQAGIPRWETGLECDLPNIIGTLPVWPPFQNFSIARVNAEDEIALLRHLVSIPGLAESARERFYVSDNPDQAEYFKKQDKETLASELDWD